MLIDPELLAIVRCPQCRGEVVERDLRQDTVLPPPSRVMGLVCEACRLVYPILDEVPNFLVEDALSLDGGPAKAGHADR